MLAAREPTCASHSNSFSTAAPDGAPRIEYSKHSSRRFRLTSLLPHVSLAPDAPATKSAVCHAVADYDQHFGFRCAIPAGRAGKLGATIGAQRRRRSSLLHHAERVRAAKRSSERVVGAALIFNVFARGHFAPRVQYVVFVGLRRGAGRKAGQVAFSVFLPDLRRCGSNGIYRDTSVFGRRVDWRQRRDCGNLRRLFSSVAAIMDFDVFSADFSLSSSGAFVLVAVDCLSNRVAILPRLESSTRWRFIKYFKQCRVDGAHRRLCLWRFMGVAKTSTGKAMILCPKNEPTAEAVGSFKNFFNATFCPNAHHSHNRTTRLVKVYYAVLSFLRGAEKLVSTFCSKRKSKTKTPTAMLVQYELSVP